MKLSNAFSENNHREFLGGSRVARRTCEPRRIIYGFGYLDSADVVDLSEMELVDRRGCPWTGCFGDWRLVDLA